MEAATYAAAATEGMPATLPSARGREAAPARADGADLCSIAFGGVCGVCVSRGRPGAIDRRRRSEKYAVSTDE